ncbi:siderophore-interacting protein [Vibrio tapetis]|uniref:Siderophore-interacting protein n=1 Tax=Vibrio tapetis subsp. tapetis TaxID=1671868 RepID=A0A2N8ZAM8_9VIBR|nr:siderophore-interacting protein [Vibrio tapetis]SON48946.1 conserved protein of unknown function [Vibrio tapetis subsp. tapetis]
MNSHTQISNVDHKIDIIDHVNQDHQEELLAIAKTHASNLEIKSAKVEDIFEEGVRIEVDFKMDPKKQMMFVPFEIEGSLEDKILYLAYAGIVKQGQDFSGSGKQFFEVLGKQNITENIIRLTVGSNMALPEYYPGYAYAFVLKGMKKKAIESTHKNDKKHWIKSISDHLFIWLMKNLSKKNREKMLYKTNKNVRLYTLRRSWKSSDTVSFYDRGEIDIYTHGETTGSQWAEQLSIGDVIMSRSETADKHPHLVNGQALMIADETAYPALAGILENWKGQAPPIVILVSAKATDQSYFSGDAFPENSSVHRVVCAENEQGEKVLTILKALEQIDVVWAALESSAAKAIRHYLRNERNVSGKNNHTKAYWNLKPRKPSD